MKRAGRALVLGASGFVGRSVCAHLATKGVAVRALTRSTLKARPLQVFADLDQLGRADSARHALAARLGLVEPQATQHLRHQIGPFGVDDDGGAEHQPELPCDAQIERQVAEVELRRARARQPLDFLADIGAKRIERQ